MTATILESLVLTKINLSLCQFFLLNSIRWNSGQRCRYGRFCTYAHGEEELKSWMEYKNEEQENESDLRKNEHYLSSRENKTRRARRVRNVKCEA